MGDRIIMKKDYEIFNRQGEKLEQTFDAPAGYLATILAKTPTEKLLLCQAWQMIGIAESLINISASLDIMRMKGAGLPPWDE